MVEALATYRGAAADVVAGLWEGFGWIDGGGVSVLFVSDGGPTADELEARRQGPSVRGAFEPDVLAAPRLDLPHRSYRFSAARWPTRDGPRRRRAVVDTGRRLVASESEPAVGRRPVVVPGHRVDLDSTWSVALLR